MLSHVVLSTYNIVVPQNVFNGDGQPPLKVAPRFLRAAFISKQYALKR